MAVICKPPLPKPHVLSSLVCSLFPFKEFECGTVKSLESYDDRNIFFQGRPESSYLQAFSKLLPENGFIGKIFRRRVVSEGLKEFEGQMLALEFAAQRGCFCPQPIRSRRGQLLEEVTTKQLAPEENDSMQPSSDGSYYLGVVSFLPGVTLHTVKKTPQVLKECGQALGKLNYTLKDFHHDALRHRKLEKWNLTYFMDLRADLDRCNTEPLLKKSLLKVFSDFEHFIIPRLPHLTSGIRHSDCNDMNMICSELADGSCDTTKPFGMIDFGDCMHGPYIFDLGTAVGYELLGKEEPLKEVVHVLEGFVEEFPLPKEELSLVFYVALARLAQSYINGQAFIAEDPDNEEYLSLHSVPAQKVLCEFAFLPKDAVDKAWSSVLL